MYEVVKSGNLKDDVLVPGLSVPQKEILNWQ